MNIQNTQGTGVLLWGVIFVDEDDTEDTTLEMWLADDEDHLYEQIKEDREFDEIIENEFEADWGYRILPKQIGTV